MFAKLTVLTAAAALFASVAVAENFEILMLNKGEEGAMVFEPAFVAAQPGDTITFIPTDKGHNAETIKGMFPEGFDKFKSKLGKEFSITLDLEGLYGIKCTPHYGMGMVALIQVGEPVNLELTEAVKLKGKAKKRFAPLFEQVTTELAAAN
ncbi:pseudoazurin [Parasedimentitalea marina]|uniref:Pseudoazurin n=1 Tax=Parasedimentitalea marina TaxID=2483033 RepID=A0A3T0N3I8_9RHOB|nr:pseudoazurin [Parasedimentitalea marina]AZV78595.1 pseudoazurin [Parasedimentitalea marina]